MFQVIAFGLAIGAGVQAWRNFPPDGPVAGDMLALVFVVGVVLAYVGGRWRGRHGARAYASASAHAEASSASSAVSQQAVQVFVSAPGEGARPVGYSMPSDQAPWLATSVERPALTLDQLDGMELEELCEESEQETTR